jgi:hypothetical protein
MKVYVLTFRSCTYAYTDSILCGCQAKWEIEVYATREEAEEASKEKLQSKIFERLLI